MRPDGGIASDPHFSHLFGDFLCTDTEPKIKKKFGILTRAERRDFSLYLKK